MSQSASKDPHHPHDKFFKAVFKQPEHVREILEAVAPEAVLSALRLDTLRLSDASFVDEQLAEHFADIVLHCDTADSNPSAYISMLLEHKSYVPAFVPLQLMRYQQNGWTQQVRQSVPVPVPIVPVLFFHGEEDWPLKSWPEHLHGWNDAFVPRNTRPYGCESPEALHLRPSLSYSLSNLSASTLVCRMTDTKYIPAGNSPTGMIAR